MPTGSSQTASVDFLKPFEHSISLQLVDYLDGSGIDIEIVVVCYLEVSIQINI